MIRSWTVVALSLSYIGVLFAIAYYGDRRVRGRGRPASKPIVYALSLAVYCTSWTFYGSVGLAARTGYEFLTIYVGPILMFALGWPLVRRIVRISKSHNITSIADFIAARYGKSQRLAAAVATIAVIGTLPYIALQLKALSTSFTMLLRYPVIGPPGLAEGGTVWDGTALAVSLVLALFAILFGTRHIDATEHNEGMILAIAFESVVKLLAFLAVGAFVTWGMFGGFGDLAGRVAADPELQRLFFSGIDGPRWLTMSLLALLAILCLPRQFHVAVVENASERDVRKAAWLFPLYLVAINLFVIPIAIAGRASFAAGTVDADMFVLALPIAAQQPALAFAAFIGGLSAATGMAIVASIAVSNMVSNNLIMPIVLRGRRMALAERTDMGALILNIRRISITALMLLAYLYYRVVGDSAALASIGLLSFAAAAQFAPALLGGLMWRRATAAGALCGIAAGALAWAYTLLLPSLVRAGWLPDFLAAGPFGVALLRPEQLLGLRFDPLTHGVFWSLLANVGCYVAVSLAGRPKLIERMQASAFLDAEGGADMLRLRSWQNAVRIGELGALIGRYLGAERAERVLAEWAAQRGGASERDAPADLEAVRHTERVLASAIGAPSARLVMALALERRDVSARAAIELLDDATAAIQYNRELLQSALENVRQGICVFDRALRLVCWNNRFSDLLGLPPELTRVGVALHDILRFNAERGEYGPGPVDGLVARRLDWFAGDAERVSERPRPNGTVLEVRVGPLPGGGCVATYSDITERVRAAAALAAANEQLEQRVRERTAALTALNAELSAAKTGADQANIGKTRFLAAASHDLLQPLNAARLYVSSLLERSAEAGPQPDDRAIVGKIDASLTSVEELLGALLDISRLDAGALNPQLRPFRLSELLDALRVEFAPLAERNGLDLRIVPTGLVVQSDRRLLHRLLQNLLSNAIRYTRHGRVLMGARRSGGSVLIQVCDTGSGIPPERHAIVFEEFRRFAPAPGMEHGLGLGLSIVERISRMLDHRVTLRSAPGHGTMFSVQVPRGEAVAAAAIADGGQPRPLPAFERALVLCVDNEPRVLDGMRTLLEGWGCQVQLAADPEAACALVEGGARPNLVLVDYHLGGGEDGIGCIRRLRQLCGEGLGAVLVTADRSEVLAARARRLGLPLLSKPLKPATLRALMMRLLATQRAAE